MVKEAWEGEMEESRGHEERGEIKEEEEDDDVEKHLSE